MLLNGVKPCCIEDGRYASTTREPHRLTANTRWERRDSERCMEWYAGMNDPYPYSYGCVNTWDNWHTPVTHESDTYTRECERWVEWWMFCSAQSWLCVWCMYVDIYVQKCKAVLVWGYCGFKGQRTVRREWLCA